jgi:hypothetical protein
MESSREDVAIKLASDLQERVRAFAEKEVLTLDEAVSALLELGMEFVGRQRIGLRELIEDVQHDLNELREMVDVLGPAALGTQRILAHWAAQTGGLRVSEDELLAEGRMVAGKEWQSQLAERGLLSPSALNRTPEA